MTVLQCITLQAGAFIMWCAILDMGRVVVSNFFLTGLKRAAVATSMLVSEQILRLASRGLWCPHTILEPF